MEDEVFIADTHLVKTRCQNLGPASWFFLNFFSKQLNLRRLSIIKCTSFVGQKLNV